MSEALDPRIVVERLAELRSRFVPETVDEARERLAREQPRPRRTLAQVAQRSLDELRALCGLTRVLHTVSRSSGGTTSILAPGPANADRTKR